MQRIAGWNSARDVWETDQIDLLSGRSVVYSETFPTSGSMRNGAVYEHQTSAHLMDASGSLFSQLGGKLMPTPAASVANDGEGTETWLARRERVKQTANNGNGMGMPLTIAVQLLPTPMTTDDHHSSHADANRRSPWLRAVHALFPTPDAYSAERGGSQHPDKRRAGGHSVSLADVAEQQLLPTPRSADHSHSLTAPAARRHVDDGNGALAEVIGYHLLPTPKAGDGDFGQPRTSGRPPEKSTHLATRLAFTLPTPRATRGGSNTEIAYLAGGERTDEHRVQGSVDLPEQTSWGPYAAAISRWEAILGRPAPDHTESGPKGGRRLAAAFVEWMMGCAEGWVTSARIGLTRTQQLKALGNGVVTLQALHALQLAAVAA